jgi:hypothetical protein
MRITFRYRECVGLTGGRMEVVDQKNNHTLTCKWEKIRHATININID